MSEQKTKGGQRHNQNASKAAADKRSSRVVVNVTAREKAQLVKTANGKMNPWARRQLGLPE